MNVCIVNPNFYRSSGVTIAVKRIHEAVSKHGIENYFVNCNSDALMQDISWMPDGRLLKFNLMTLNPFRLLRELFLFFTWVKINKIDVIHVHHRRLAVLFAMCKYFFDGKLLYSANLTYKFSLLFWLFSPVSVIAITKSVVDNVKITTRARYIEEIGNPTAFPDVIPDNRFQADQRHAICVARLDPVKGHKYLIEAWNLLAKKGFSYQLTLVGEGQLLDQLKNRVTELGLDSLVNFYGYTSDVLSLYEKSLFSILVSEVEGQGIVTIEAAASGRASLLTDVDGSRDCLPPNRLLSNGVQFSDVEGLANAIEYWFANPTSVLDEGLIFFDFHKALNSFEAVGEKYAKAYRRLVK